MKWPPSSADLFLFTITAPLSRQSVAIPLAVAPFYLAIWRRV